jgi:K+-transporting ATPase ATPase A chain
MFGRMIRFQRHARLILVVMLALVIAGIAGAVVAEQHGSPVLRASHVDLTAGHGQSGGNLADKEVRFGAMTSAFFTSVTTASSGSGIDAGHDAFTPIGGGVPLLNMFVGIVGGVGSGMWSILLKIVLSVFVASLMIGRTPHYLGKRIDAYEMKLVALGLLAVPVFVLAATALSVASTAGRASIFNPGAHGFTETLYAYTSQANNNGSAFAGFGFTSFAAVLGTLVMLLGRFVPILIVLALAGSLVRKSTTPDSAGTLRTDTRTFGVLLLGVIVVTAGLTIVPAFVLGPVVEGLSG